MITTTIKTKNEIVIKMAKPYHGKLCQIYLGQKYANKTLNLIPIHFRILKQDIKQTEEGCNIITVNTNAIFRKKTSNTRTLRIYLPEEYVGVSFLIFEAEEIDFLHDV